MSDLYIRKVTVMIQSQVGGSRTIENLRVQFTIEKNNESNPNTSTIKIFNLAPATKGLLEAKNTKIVLSAGYQDTIETLAIGDVTKVVHETQGPDIISTIEIGDGDKSFRTARIEQNFPAGATTRQVIDALIDASGLQAGSKLGVPNSQYANGISLSGLVRDQLTDITRKNELEWSVQNEVLQIIPKTSFTLDSVILLNAASGLIGSPNKTAKGVEFKSLLQPKLKPGGRVQIESRNLNGIFKVRKVTHDGDSRQGDFLSKCEATA